MNGGHMPQIQDSIGFYAIVSGGRLWQTGMIGDCKK